MITSSNALSIIALYEGYRDTSYKCPAGVWTLGYGSTYISPGNPVTAGMSCTKQSAMAMLGRDVQSAENILLASVTVPLTQNQWDAAISFIYNIGGGNWRSSTMLKRLNAGDYSAAADEILRWNKAGGKVLQGLVNRRNAERDLFLAE